MPASTKSLRSRFAKVLATLPEPTKDSTNPHFKNAYVSLGGLMTHLRKPLADAGLAVTQSLTTAGENGQSRPIVRTTLLATDADDELPLGDCPVAVAGNATAQQYGSAVTYARRYGLMAAFGLAGEDDDGHAASSGSNKSGGDDSGHDFF